MLFSQTMTVTNWGAWIGYEIVVAALVYAKTLFWFRRELRVSQVALTGWVSLTVVAFFAAVGLNEWLGTSYQAALIAFGIAAATIVSAAVNASYELGMKAGQRGRTGEKG